MKLKELLVVERVAKEATRRHRRALLEAQDDFERQWPDDWAYRVAEWDRNNPFAKFVTEVWEEYLEVAALIRDHVPEPVAQTGESEQ